MSDLTHLLAQRVRDHDGQLGNIEDQLELYGRALGPVLTARQLHLDYCARERGAAAFRSGRADTGWKDRMPGAQALRRREVSKALEDGALAALRMRDGSRDAAFRENCNNEAGRLIGASRALA